MDEASVEVPLAGDVQHVRPVTAPGLDGKLVQRSRAGPGAEDADDGRLGGEAELRPAVRARDVEVRLRDRTPDDPNLRAAAAGNVVREKETARERRRQPVRETEVRVRLGECRGDSAEPGCQHHRPRDEAARPEDDLRPALGEDAEAVRRRG